jgi:hypothetical protein
MLASPDHTIRNDRLLLAKSLLGRLEVRVSSSQFIPEARISAFGAMTFLKTPQIQVIVS